VRVLKSKGVSGVAVFVSFLIVFAALVSSQRETSAQDPLRESEACLDCHEELLESLLETPHRIVGDGAGDEVYVACTDCHPGSEDHYEDDPEDYPMTNPAKVEFAMTAQICASCHENNHQQNMWERNPHPDNGVGCTDCHQIHGVTRAGLLKDDEVEMCYGCHTNVRGEFAQPFRHPVSDGIIKCSDCHMVLDRKQRPLSFARIDAVCFQCHQYFQGPFPYEHQAAVEYSTQEGGCLACHRPHGSNQPRMLNRLYEAPDFNLCSQCHVVPLGHNNNSRHGDMWAGVPCNDCHVDIHGSYVSQMFFSPALQGRGCFNTGCHRWK
jgi:DmsE family decaheme c-type cytochrome